MPWSIDHDTTTEQWGDHMHHSIHKVLGKTKQENVGGKFWTPTAKFDYDGSHHGLQRRGSLKGSALIPLWSKKGT